MDSSGRIRSIIQTLTLLGVLCLLVLQHQYGERISQFIEEQAVADSLESVVTHDGKDLKVVTYRRLVDGRWETDQELEDRHFARCARLQD